MKRCPQCEFIYEDDQSLCDMDGVLLVFDSRTLPNLHALTTLPPPAAKELRRNRAVPAFATLILALVLGMVYYVTMRQTNPENTSSALTIAPIAIPATEVPPLPSLELTPAKEESKPSAAKQPAPAPAKNSASRNAPVSQTKPAAEPKKDDSKVNSILKKTGRILKKPFKF